MLSAAQFNSRDHATTLRAAGVLMLLATASCSQQEPQPLRIAANPWPGYEYFFLAQELG